MRAGFFDFLSKIDKKNQPIGLVFFQSSANIINKSTRLKFT